MPEPLLIPDAAEIEALISDEIAQAEADGDADGIEEARLWLVLARAWAGALLPLLEAGLLDTIDRDDDEEITEDELEEATAILATAVSVTFVASVLAPFASRTLQTYRAARTAEVEGVIRFASIPLPNVSTETSPSILLRLGAPDERSIAWAQRYHAFWITHAHERRVEPEIAAVAERVLREGLSRRAAGEAMQDALGNAYAKGISYWRVVANAAVQTTRELGRLSAYEAAGIEEVILDGVADDRQSEVCDFLDGKRIRVDALLEWRAELLKLTSPDDVQAHSPWYTGADVPRLRAMESDGVMPASIGLPGYHGLCRTRTRVILPSDNE